MTVAIRLAMSGFAVGLFLIVVGVFIGKPAVGIVGGYNLGGPATQPVLLKSGPGLFGPADGNMWIGAGLAVLVVTVVALFLTHRRAAGPLGH